MARVDYDPPATDPRSAQEEEVELLDYLRVVVQYRWLILAGALIGGLGALLYGQPVFSLHKAQFVLIPVEVVEDGSRFGLIRQRNYRYLDLLKSFPVALKVADHDYHIKSAERTVSGPLHVCLAELAQIGSASAGAAEMSAEEQASARANAAVVAQNMLQVEQKQSGIMNAEIETSSPELALQVANAYIVSLKEYDEHLRTQRSTVILDLVRTRLDSVTGDLRRAEEEERLLLGRNSGFRGEGEIFQIPELMLELKRIQRLVAAKSKLYEMLQQNYEQARIEVTSLSSGIEMLSPPTLLSGSSVSPPKKMWLSAGGGGLVATLLAFCMHYWRQQREMGKTEFVREALRRDWRRLRRAFSSSK